MRRNRVGHGKRRMLRWICAVEKMDIKRNEIIRGTTKVGEISKCRKEWYGHVMRSMESNIVWGTSS